MSGAIVDKIYHAYEKLSKDGDFINPVAYYQRNEVYKNVYEEMSTYIDLPAIEITKDIEEQLTPTKHKGTFEKPTSPKIKPKRPLEYEEMSINAPEPYIDPDLKLPIKMCYPTAGYCSKSPIKKSKQSVSRPSSPKPNLSPKIILPQLKTSLTKIQPPLIHSPKKTPPSTAEKKDKNIIKIIKNIDQAKLIPKKMGSQSGYQSEKLKEIAQQLGLKPKSNKVQMIDQIKEVITQYT